MKKIFLTLGLVLCAFFAVACGDIGKNNTATDSAEQSTSEEQGNSSTESGAGQSDSSIQGVPVPPIGNGGGYDFD